MQELLSIIEDAERHLGEAQARLDSIDTKRLSTHLYRYKECVGKYRRLDWRLASAKFQLLKMLLDTVKSIAYPNHTQKAVIGDTTVTVDSNQLACDVETDEKKLHLLIYEQSYDLYLKEADSSFFGHQHMRLFAAYCTNRMDFILEHARRSSKKFRNLSEQLSQMTELFSGIQRSIEGSCLDEERRP